MENIISFLILLTTSISTQSTLDLNTLGTFLPGDSAFAQRTFRAENLTDGDVSTAGFEVGSLPLLPEDDELTVRYRFDSPQFVSSLRFYVNASQSHSTTTRIVLDSGNLLDLSKDFHASSADPISTFSSLEVNAAVEEIQFLTPFVLPSSDTTVQVASTSTSFPIGTVAPFMGTPFFGLGASSAFLLAPVSPTGQTPALNANPTNFLVPPASQYSIAEVEMFTVATTSAIPETSSWVLLLVGTLMICLTKSQTQGVLLKK